MQTEFATLEEIETMRPLLVFGKKDVATLTKWGNLIRKEGLDIFLSRSAAQDRDTISWIKAGLIVLQSRTLGVEIVLAKARAENATRANETVYQSFIGNYAIDRWEKGATFRSLEAGLEIIANLCPPTRSCAPRAVEARQERLGDNVGAHVHVFRNNLRNEGHLEMNRRQDARVQ